MNEHPATAAPVAAAAAHISVLLAPSVAALFKREAGVEGAATSAQNGLLSARGLGADGAKNADLEPSAHAGRTWVDATFGRGGHSRAILANMGANDRLIAFDKDPEAIAVGEQLAASDARFEIRHDSFVAIAELPHASVDGVLMDLGVSSPQIDTPERGFSFRFNGPLDMRMDTSRGESAAQWLARAAEGDIARVIADLGEERFARAIARAVVAQRQNAPLATTGQLAALVAQVVKTREGAQHPATRTFQALRIFINRELDDLQAALDASLRVLKPAGRLAVISFHSLEDRIVKQFIAAHTREVVDRRDPAFMLGRGSAAPMPLRDIARIKPSDAEVAANARARSAILRVAERTTAPIVETAFVKKSRHV